VPCAGGSLITKIWKAIKEFKQLGLVDGPVATRTVTARATIFTPTIVAPTILTTIA